MIVAKFIKDFVYGTYRVVNAVVMWLPLFFVRILWCRLIFKKVGKKFYISRNIDIRNPRNIVVGNNCVVNKKCLLDGRGSLLKVGNNVDIAQEVMIWTEEHDIKSSIHALKTEPVVIEDNVWIASRAIILPGCTIGEGAVIAAGSIVTKDVDPYTVVAGIPAKKISVRENTLSYKLNYCPFFE